MLPREESAITPQWPLLLHGFSYVSRRRFRKHFRALRIANPERLQLPAEGPLLCYMNHPSWWDPIAGLLTARTLLPRVQHYAPMDIRAMNQYPFFRRLGLFPLDLSTHRGAAHFLRISTAILKDPAKLLWITAQGHFADVRERPVQLKPGLGALLTRLPRATVLPFAIEYTYWNERQPELLTHFGEPLTITDGPARSAAEWTIQLEARMAQTQDRLVTLALTRDANRFTTLIDNGHSGAGGVYALWQRLRGTAKPL